MVSSLLAMNEPMSALQTDQSPEPSKKSGNRRELFSTLGIILAALIIAPLLATFVFQTYEVDGPSMETTLQNKDRLIVTKTSRTWSKITRKPYVPKRYEVVVFNHKDSYGLTSAQEKQLIKRVIGLPGDRVVVKKGVVTIYNKSHPDGYAVDREGPEAGVIKDTEGNIDQTVGSNEIFLMGDNRANSLDSRAFGTVRVEHVVGKLAVRIYPFDNAQRF